MRPSTKASLNLVFWRWAISHDRHAQWTSRLDRLKALRARFTSSGRYDRAYKTNLAVQHAYERWADEVFAARTRQA